MCARERKEGIFGPEAGKNGQAISNMLGEFDLVYSLTTRYATSLLIQYISIDIEIFRRIAINDDHARSALP